VAGHQDRAAHHAENGVPEGQERVLGLAMSYDYHSGMYPELNAQTFDQLVARFLGDPPEPDDTNYFYYDEVACVMRRYGEIAINYLIQQFDQVDLSQRKSAILTALTFPPPIDRPEVLHLLRKSLEDEEPSVIRDAIDGLWLLKVREDLDRVLALKEHSDPRVQGGVLRYISRLFPDRAFPMLIEATQHPHYIVRQNAANELDEMALSEEQWREAEPHLRRLLEDESEGVRDAAKWALFPLEDLLDDWEE
jgi:HEAT repeat protein